MKVTIMPACTLCEFKRSNMIRLFTQFGKFYVCKNCFKVMIKERLRQRKENLNPVLRPQSVSSLVLS